MRSAGDFAMTLTYLGAKIADLPLHHRDPFDRLLAAQVLLLPAQLITTDSELVRLV